MTDNPFNSTERGSFNGEQPVFGDPSPPQQKQPQSGPQINWEPAVAGFVADQAWEKYGGTPQIEKEIEIPSKLQWAIR
jgi:hypothetical protein